MSAAAPDPAPHLAIHVHLLDDRWHGLPEWPPAPFRLFQALVAAAARGDVLAEEDAAALAWLEEREPPMIIAPEEAPGREYVTFVPNNDLDAVGGNPDRVGEIRVGKLVRPWLLMADARLSYVWRDVAGDMPSEHFDRLEDIAHRLYQFGRGVDMAFARMEWLDEVALKAISEAPGFRLFRPRPRGRERPLAVPARGSLNSVRERYADMRGRLQTHVEGRNKVKQLFRQPRKAFFGQACYECAPRRRVFALRSGEDATIYAPWRRTKVVALVERLRDEAAARLKTALPERVEEIERFLVGRDAGKRDKAWRVRIVPLPSIGHVHAGGAIRRVLVEVPQGCPLRAEDVFWAFTNLSPDERVDPQTGEIIRNTVLSNEDDGFVDRHFTEPALRWRTVTPAALPVKRRGRLSGSERLHRERQAIAAVRQALRHAGVAVRAVSIRVQREPFDRNAAPAGEYAAGRFHAGRLWHVEIVFDRPVSGPLIVGDGRYLGLGLMAPVREDVRRAESEPGDAFLFRLPGEGVLAQDGGVVLKYLRAALMRHDAETHRREQTCPLFSGHERHSAAPARSGAHRHVFLAAPPDADGRVRDLLVIAPWLADNHPDARKPDTLDKENPHRHFIDVVRGLRALYGPELPRTPLVAAPPAEVDEHPLLAPARIWRSTTPVVSTRHYRAGRDGTPEAFLAEDIRRELRRRRLPRGEAEKGRGPLPESIDVIEATVGRDGRVRGLARLEFHAPVRGPFLLGWGSHGGQGTFVGEPPRA